MLRLSVAVTSICLSQDDKLCELCAIGNDNRAWVCSAFEVRAGGVGVCVVGGKCGGVRGVGGSDGVEGEMGIVKLCSNY